MRIHRANNLAKRFHNIFSVGCVFFSVRFSSHHGNVPRQTLWMNTWWDTRIKNLYIQNEMKIICGFGYIYICIFSFFVALYGFSCLALSFYHQRTLFASIHCVWLRLSVVILCVSFQQYYFVSCYFRFDLTPCNCAGLVVVIVFPAACFSR